MTTKKLTSGYSYDEIAERTEQECKNAGFDDQLERCDFAAEVFEANCRTKYQGDNQKAERDRCIAQISTYHTYCDHDTCYNVTGGCGDGIKNEGEQCDSRVETDPEQGFYYDIDGWKRSGGNGGNGLYCTGECRGNCTPDVDGQKDRCQNDSDTDCWEYNKKGSAAEYWATVGCTRFQHNGQFNSKCGDNSIDTFAGEVCDDGNTQDGDYCAANCKSVTGSCGDGIKHINETCDNSSTCKTDATVNGQPNDCTKVKGDYCSSGCDEDYGKCGDNNIKGPGFNWYDGHTADDSKVTLSLHNQLDGPEDFDTTDNRTKSMTDTLSSDAEKETFIKTFAKTDSAGKIECKRKDTCGDGTRNFRLEGCDCGNGDGHGTCNISSYNGALTFSTTCYKDCYSAAIGGVDVAHITSKSITGWACDPDHPMLDGDPSDTQKMVRIKFKNKSGTYDSHTMEVITGEQIPDAFNKNDVITICGGGKLHGWSADPSSAGIDPLGSPYTIEVYALSRDEGEKAEVLIGTKTNFITAMQCGDGVKTNCSSIYVTTADGSQLQLYNGWQCKDTEVQGGCSAFGFEKNEICRDEACENGVDGVDFSKGAVDCFDKDYPALFKDGTLIGRKCQWTWCGDGIKQSEATDIRAHEGAPGMGGEECEKPGTTVDEKSCTSLGLTLPTGDAATEKDFIWGQTKTCDNTCKYDRTAGCKLTSKCPSLKEVVQGWIDNGRTEYDADKYSQYIVYHSETYTRNWVCDSEGCHWSEKKSAEYNAESDNDSLTCRYHCKDTLYWNGSYCAPRNKDVEAQRIETSCNQCKDTDNNIANGVWSGTSTDCFNGAAKTAYIGTKIEDGDVKYVVPQPNGTTTTVDVGLSKPTLDAKYDNSASPTWQCSWKCHDNTYTYSEKKNKCYKNDKPYTCNGKPEGALWVKVKGVTKEGSNVTGVITEILSSSSATLTVPQKRTGFNGDGEAVYDPDENEKFTGAGLTNIKKLQPMYVNADSGLSAYNQRTQIANYFDSNYDGYTNGNPRCFWVCPVGKKIKRNDIGDYECVDPTAGNEEQRCPAGLTNEEKTKIYNEDCSKVKEAEKCEVRAGFHQKCNDTFLEGSTLNFYNGQYGSTTVAGQTVTYCNKYCGEKKSGENWVEDTTDTWGRIKYKDDSDGTLKYYCGDGVTQPTAETISGITNWHQANSTNYPGASVFADELCDGTPDTNARKQLCDRYLSKNGATTATSVNATYHNNSSISCNSNCQGMTNISGTTASNINYTDKNYPCGFCGDGKINYKNSSTQEKCDPGLNTAGGYDDDKWAETTETSSTGTTMKCKKDCSGWAPYCGDGTPQTGEACDKGSSNTDTAPSCGYDQTCDYCNKSCESKSVKGPYCGDGTVNGTEKCDTGISTLYSCYESTSWTTGSGCSAESHSGYNIYKMPCSSCGWGAKEYITRIEGTTTTYSVYTSKGACSSFY